MSHKNVLRRYRKQEKRTQNANHMDNTKGEIDEKKNIDRDI